MITKGYEEIHNKMIMENEMLRESLALIQKELNEIMNQRKEIYLKRKRIEFGDDYDEEIEGNESIVNIKRDLFNMPIDNVRRPTQRSAYPLALDRKRDG